MNTKSKFSAIFGLILAIFVFVNLAGLNLSAATMNDGMNDCPIMQGMDSLCQMGLINHIESWFNMMSSILPEILILILLAVVASTASYLIPNTSSLHTFLRARQRWRNNYLNLFIPLRFALSHGIIQPKLYN